MTRWQFFITLTNDAGKIRRVVRMWDESGDPRNPFQQIIFTPLSSSRTTVSEIRRLKEERGATVMFDSGGYQVQMGKISYSELCIRLRDLYAANDWADWYVLPDHVPRSSDGDDVVARKVRETIESAAYFLEMQGLAQKALGVIHGHTQEQVRFCIESYAKMRIQYVGFGSFGTSGPGGAINRVSDKSIRLLQYAQSVSRYYGLRLHIFGIGSPNYLMRLSRAGIMPDSFDSSGWWKAGAYGNIFFPNSPQLRTSEIEKQKLMSLKAASGHSCAFCSNTDELPGNRYARIMHNLCALMDTIERLRQ